MAKGAAISESKPGPITRLQNFLKEVRVEMDKVSWPSAEDLKVSTKVTLFLILAIAAVIFVFDKVFEGFVFLLLSFA